MRFWVVAAEAALEVFRLRYYGGHVGLGVAGVEVADGALRYYWRSYVSPLAALEATASHGSARILTRLEVAVESLLEEV